MKSVMTVDVNFSPENCGMEDISTNLWYCFVRVVQIYERTENTRGHRNKWDSSMKPVYCDMQYGSIRDISNSSGQLYSSGFSLMDSRMLLSTTFRASHQA